MPAPSGRLHQVYSPQERAAINPFKHDYFEATTPAARKSIAQAHIFPALFNYWVSIGVDINQDEMKVRSQVN
jgi:hypothetical protein